jgi:hypothetical protein
MLLLCRKWTFILLAGLLTGCASTPPSQTHLSQPAGLFPANALLTQRALFTARERQFALNGYLALSETGGKRLVVTETFGNVMADVLVKPNGKVFVMQSSRMFPEKYIRRLMAADLECVFGNATNKNCPVTMLDTNHFVIDRSRYKLELRIVEMKSSAQPAELFDETKAEKR